MHRPVNLISKGIRLVTGSYPSGVYKENRILCDDFTIVNISGGTVTDLTTCYTEEKDVDGNSFDPIRYTSTFKPGFNSID